MSNKKRGLAETFIKHEERLQQSEQPNNTSLVPAQSEPQLKSVANARIGKRHIGGYFDKDVWVQLKILSIEKGGITLQQMLTEALNNYFTVNDKPPIAK